MDLVLEVLFEIDFEVKKGAAACAKRLYIYPPFLTRLANNFRLELTTFVESPPT